MGNKAILMSIRPQYVAKILNGEKTIEVRKKFPKDYVGWVYIYCTKGNGCLDYDIEWKTKKWFWWTEKDYKNILPNVNKFFNGKVVARFWCDKVGEIYCQLHFNGFALETETMGRDTLNKKSCLTDKELREYFNRGVYNFNETYGYAIHISKLKVFDKPKELKSFVYYSKGGGSWCSWLNCIYLDHTKEECANCKEIHLQKAPQSWCYVEGEND